MANRCKQVQASSSLTKEDVITTNEKPLEPCQCDSQETESLYMSIQKALMLEKQLEENSRKEELKSKLRYAKCRASLKGSTDLQSDWKYYPLTAKHCVPNKSAAPIPSFPKKNTRRNPHHKSAPFGNRIAWREFKALDEAAKITSLMGLPCPINEKIKNPLEKDSDVVRWIGDFAVNAFNDSYQMYVNHNNKKNIRKAEITDCYYLKLEECYLFYITIQAIEQKNRGFYNITVKCKFDNGDITLDLFSLQDGYSSGSREAAISCQKSIYETVADGWTEHDLYYTGGIVRRKWCGGYDYRNPFGFNQLRFLSW